MSRLDSKERNAPPRSVDSLTLLKEEIYRHPLVEVTPANFESLGENDTARRERAFLGNRRLCITIAGRFSGQGAEKGISFIELVQRAQIGLWRASQRYDPNKGYKFSTYAWRTIEGYLQHIISQKKEKPTLPYITSENSGEDCHGVYDETYRNPRSYNPLDLILEAEKDAENVLGNALDEALDRIPVKTERVIRTCFAVGYVPKPYEMPQVKRNNHEITFEQAGEKMGVTKQRIEQLHQAGLKKLRENPELRLALNIH